MNPTARAIMRGAKDIAKLFDSDRVESLHYLLALLAEEDSIAVAILRELRLDTDEIAERAMQDLGFDTWPLPEPRNSPAYESMSDAEFRKYRFSRRRAQLIFRVRVARRAGNLYDATRLRLQLEAWKRLEAQSERCEHLFTMEQGRLRRRI
jgi:hypothetical protein